MLVWRTAGRILNPAGLVSASVGLDQVVVVVAARADCRNPAAETEESRSMKARTGLARVNIISPNP